MTPDTAAALAYLREQFGEGWEFSVHKPMDWVAIATRGTDALGEDTLRLRAYGPNPMSAARACVEAWREATKDERQEQVNAGIRLAALFVEDHTSVPLAEMPGRLRMLQTAPISPDDLRWAAEAVGRLVAHDARRSGAPQRSEESTGSGEGE